MILPKSAQQLMKDNMIVKHYAGSHSYGTALPSSDVDFRGIFCCDKINLLTPFFPIRECEDTNEEDTKLYELSHYLKLCLDCNPNIIETLWCDEKDIVFTTPAYQLLRDSREKLLSSKIAFTTSGYAIAQLKRIKGHHKWINNPQPKQSPVPCQFISVVQWFGKNKNLKIDLSLYRHNHQLIPYGDNIFGVYPNKGSWLWDDAGALVKTSDVDDRSELQAPLMIIKWNQQEYKLAKHKHAQYWQWKNNRNKKRSELEEKFQFDTKHAMHLVRLLRMGKEALETGQIIVKRPDAQELLDIRNGKWSYEQILQYAEHMDHNIRNKLYKQTNLPKKPDIKFAANLLMQVQELLWSK